MSKKTILLTTATGTVGARMVTLLLDQGFHINALVRNTDSEAAQKLKVQGVTLFKGDFNDIPSIEAAAQGIFGVFVNAVSTMINMDEHTHNNNVITTARKAGAKVGVYMSVVSADHKDEFPRYGPEHPSYNYWEAKYRSEKDLQEAGFDHWTIIRPAVFLSNFLPPLGDILFPHLKKEHTLLWPSLKSENLFPLVDPLDIAKFCAAPFWDTDSFSGQSIDLTTEYVTFTDLADKITQITGISVKAEFVTPKAAAARGLPERPNEWEEWKEQTNFKIDMDHVKSFPVKLSSVDEFLEKHKDEFIKYLS
ncbi:hypothetical protein INT43_000073 [Umbelopsis isabellina]|uniref:NmrA-like domain-containing protein n=1 Tax=Mortierella isabellina TaxID=91625 RepID=A0A8H7PG77_MORIS|nr:hypothetical protein INT43_000073 [Umbelopsis isabellina]